MKFMFPEPTRSTGVGETFLLGARHVAPYRDFR
jgi:hypothetical protein